MATFMYKLCTTYGLRGIFSDVRPKTDIFGITVHNFNDIRHTIWFKMAARAHELFRHRKMFPMATFTLNL